MEPANKYVLSLLKAYRISTVHQALIFPTQMLQFRL